MRVGLEALKVDLSSFLGALLRLLVLGNLIAALQYWAVEALRTSPGATVEVLMIWMDLGSAECLPLISMYIWETAPQRVVSLYSLYMLTVSVLVRYLRTIP